MQGKGRCRSATFEINITSESYRCWDVVIWFVRTSCWTRSRQLVSSWSHQCQRLWCAQVAVKATCAPRCFAGERSLVGHHGSSALGPALSKQPCDPSQAFWFSRSWIAWQADGPSSGGLKQGLLSQAHRHLCAHTQALHNPGMPQRVIWCAFFFSSPCTLSCVPTYTSTYVYVYICMCIHTCISAYICTYHFQIQRKAPNV